jgi:acetolactate synthase regulatory subunit
MHVELKILARNDATALPRVLRLVARQGCRLKRLTLQPDDAERLLELFLVLECPEAPLRLVKLLQKQIVVAEVWLANADRLATG